MPIFTTSLNLSAATPRISPERIWSAKARNRSSVSCTSGTTFLPSTRMSASVGARSATCRTARFSVMLIGSPANIASRSARDLGPLGEREKQLHRFRHDAVLRIVEREVAEREREAREAIRIDGEEIAEMRIAHRLAMRAELLERGVGGGLHALSRAACSPRAPVLRCGPSRRAAIASLRRRPRSRRRRSRSTSAR